MTSGKRARRPRPQITIAALVAVGAFALYLASSLALEARGATELFGADTGLYVWLGHGNSADRITRFHPLSTILIVGWMKLFAPLTAWLTPAQILKGLFAAVGALGVLAAMWTFAAVMPRRYVPFWGVIYATSLGSWYFASIEESKIITATLTALYLATYVRLRVSFSLRRVILLSAILLAACLNEIVAGFLVVIPAVDALAERGVDLRRDYWIALHALVAPAVLAFLEIAVNGRLSGASSDPEQAWHTQHAAFLPRRQRLQLGYHGDLPEKLAVLQYRRAEPLGDARLPAVADLLRLLCPGPRRLSDHPLGRAAVALRRRDRDRIGDGHAALEQQ